MSKLCQKIWIKLYLPTIAPYKKKKNHQDESKCAMCWPTLSFGETPFDAFNEISILQIAGGLRKMLNNFDTQLLMITASNQDEWIETSEDY